MAGTSPAMTGGGRADDNSIHLEVRRADHLGPFLHVGGEELAELRRPRRISRRYRGRRHRSHARRFQETGVRFKSLRNPTVSEGIGGEAKGYNEQTILSFQTKDVDGRTFVRRRACSVRRRNKSGHDAAANIAYAVAAPTSTA